MSTYIIRCNRTIAFKLFSVSYGDRVPKSIPARLFAILWTWIGIATMAVITSSITASLMSMVFQPEKMLYGTRVNYDLFIITTYLKEHCPRNK